MRYIFVEVAAIVVLCVVAVSPIDAAVPAGRPFVYKTVGQRELKLYVTQPADWKPSDRRAAIVFYHGGAWVGGRPGQFTEHSKYVASRGMVAVQVEYRLLSREGNDPPLVCVQDAKSAMRWVRSRAAKFGIAPDRIASAGGSAGGHLAAFVGMVDGLDDPKGDARISPKSNAMVLFNPVYDNGPDGWEYERVAGRYKEFSPFHNVSADDPPCIVFLGTKDNLVPVKTAEAFQSAMRAAGNHAKLLVFEGKSHGFFNYGRDGNRPYYETVVAMDKFLASLGWLTGPPTLEMPE